MLFLVGQHPPMINAKDKILKRYTVGIYCKRRVLLRDAN